MGIELTGHSLGRYHILEQLGEGGMATVYKAYDTRLEREVAVKIIRRGAFPPEHLNRILKRFEREAKSLASLSHPNIVNVIDYGEHEGSPYLVMPYYSGGTLKQSLGKPMQWQEAIRLLIPIARALAYAHKRKIIHRDIKPSNILISESSEPMLSDFGIAKLLEFEGGETLTGTGVGVGTPEYMAPEQGLGKEIDGRVDIYSLGVVLYELLTGRKPYTADTPMAIVFKHMTDPLPRPRKFVPDLPDKVEQLLFKALAKQSQDRYHDMDSFVTALEGQVIGIEKLELKTTTFAKDESVNAGISRLHNITQNIETIDLVNTNEGVTSSDKLKHPNVVPARSGPKRTSHGWLWVITLVIFIGLILLGASIANRFSKNTAVTSNITPVSSPIKVPTPTIVPTKSQILDSVAPMDPVVIWEIGSPYEQEGNSKPVPKAANALNKLMASSNLESNLFTFSANEFPTEFNNAKKSNNIPDILILDNYLPLEEVMNQNPDLMERLKVLEPGSSEFDGYFIVSIADSPNYSSVLDFALREPECSIITRYKEDVETQDLLEAAELSTVAYIEGEKNNLKTYLDANAIYDGSRYDVGQVGKYKYCGVWGNTNLVFIYSVASIQTRQTLGSINVLSIFRWSSGDWNLVTISTDPVSIDSLTQAVPLLEEFFIQGNTTGGSPLPAVLLSPDNREFPVPPSGERFGDFTWEPSASSNVIAQIAEFEYEIDTRLFVLPVQGSLDLTDRISAGSLWSTDTTWHWRIWSITNTGAISFSESRSFTH